LGLIISSGGKPGFPILEAIQKSWPRRCARKQVLFVDLLLGLADHFNLLDLSTAAPQIALFFAHLIRSSATRIVDLVTQAIDRPAWWRLLSSAPFREVRPIYDATCEVQASIWTPDTQIYCTRLIGKFARQWPKETSPMAAVRSSRDLPALPPNLGRNLDQWQRSWAQVIFSVRLTDPGFQCQAALDQLHAASAEEGADECPCDRFIVAGKDRPVVNARSVSKRPNLLSLARSVPSADNLRLKSWSSLPGSIVMAGLS
jgi:hypothetical protein